jgi:hypothetical protein
MLSSPSPIRPLNIGNVVSASFRLYRDHLSEYLGIAFRATLWLLGILVLCLPIVFVASTLKENPAGAAAFLALAVPAWLVGLLYCVARYEAGLASITRLAFGALTEQPESPASALRFTQSRQWSFLGGSLLVGLMAGGVALVALGVVGIPIGMFGFSILQSSRGPEAVLALLIAGLIGLVGLLVWCVGLYWLSARLYLSLVPLAIEPSVTATVSIQRGWSLTQNSAWRLVAILFIAGMMTLPLQILVSVIQNILQVIMLGARPARAGGPMSTMFLLVSLILGQAASILIVPFMRSLQAVIYADLRSRREGLDLSLRDR